MDTKTISERYLNARVTIHYQFGQGYTDTGRITYIDDHWIEMVKEKGEKLLTPVTAVRLLKLTEPSDENAAVLLRATRGDVTQE